MGVGEYTVPDLTPEELDSMTGKYVDIPPADGKVLKEGDNVYLLVEASIDPMIWKTPNKSYHVILTVVEEGQNKGKIIDYYPGVAKEAMGLTKDAVTQFGIYDKFFVRKDGKVTLSPTAFNGARAKAKFVAQWSTPMTKEGKPDPNKKPTLRSVLDSTKFLPASGKPADIM